MSLKNIDISYYYHFFKNYEITNAPYYNPIYYSFLYSRTIEPNNRNYHFDAFIYT